MTGLPQFKKPGESFTSYESNRVIDAVRKLQTHNLGMMRLKPCKVKEKGNGVVFKITSGPTKVGTAYLFKGLWQLPNGSAVTDSAGEGYLYCPNAPENFAEGSANGIFCTAIDIGLTVKVGPTEYIIWVTTDALVPPVLRPGMILKVRNKHGHDNIREPWETIPIHRYSGVYIDQAGGIFTDLITEQNRDPNVRYWWHKEGALVLIAKFLKPGVKWVGGKGLAVDDVVIDSTKKPVEYTAIVTPDAEFHSLEVCI